MVDLIVYISSQCAVNFYNIVALVATSQGLWMRVLDKFNRSQIQNYIQPLK
jgi:hypothetical protein